MISTELLKPDEARKIIRKGKYIGPTGNWCMGYAQANLVILPEKLAYDFLLFCMRNPKPCPLLEVTDVGSPVPKYVAPSADLRFDIPLYRVFKNGEVIDIPRDLEKYWREDLVSFLLGCSFSFEDALLKAGIPSRYLDNAADQGNPVYFTNIPCLTAGPFSGNLVVSMRPIPAHQVSKAVQVTSRFPNVHGAPVHIGEPMDIGIRDIMKPDFGASPTILSGDVFVFWACGITPQIAIEKAKPEVAFSHYASRMFITDLTNESLSVL